MDKKVITVLQYFQKKNQIKFKKIFLKIKINENIIIAGDFNIIPSAEDVHDPKGYENDALYRIEIRKKLNLQIMR